MNTSDLRQAHADRLVCDAAVCLQSQGPRSGARDGLDDPRNADLPVAIGEAFAGGVGITEPLPKRRGYIVSKSTKRGVRLYRTCDIWIACEVRDAWRRGDFLTAGEYRPFKPKVNP
jgi:hypothetical protein